MGELLNALVGDEVAKGLRANGCAHAKEGNWNKAAEFFAEAIKYEGRNPENYLLYAEAAIRAGYPQLAEGPLCTALQLGATDPRIHYYLGGVFKATGRMNTAIEAYERALEAARVYGAEIAFFNNMGMELRAAGRPFAAVVAFDEAAKREPGNPRWEQLIAELESTPDPAVCATDQADRLYQSAFMALRHGDKEPAINFLQQAIQAAPQRVVYREMLAQLLCTTGRLTEAEEACRWALHLEPGNPLRRNFHGAVLHRMGVIDAAQQEFEEVIRMVDRMEAWPQGIGAAAGLAAIHEARGHGVRANWYRSAIDFYKQRAGIS